MTTPLDAPPRETCRICRHMSPEGNCPIHGERPTETTLDRAVAALLQSADSNLDNLAAVLRVLGQAEYDEVAVSMPAAFGRVSGLCWILAEQLARWDADTRSAPPLALREVVREAAVPCGYSLCSQQVLPWQFDGEHCDADCRNGSMREHGETRVGA